MEPHSVPAHRGAMPWQGLLLTASLLTFWSLPTTAQQDFPIPVESVPPNAFKGKEVLLLAQKLPETFLRLDWFRGDFQPRSNIVTLRTNPENTAKGPAHSGRETLYSNGTLLIRNLTLEGTNTYYIQVFEANVDISRGKGELHVYEPLPKPHITANNLNPMEQDFVVLTCEPESPDTTFWWFSNTNTRPIQSSTRLQLSTNNRTLTVFHITRKDTGPYECETSNPVSVHRSDPFILTVLYGPDAPVISPSKRDYHRGESLRLSCLTDSYPAAWFSWFMGEKPLGFTQTLSIPNLSLNDSGSYSCLVGNSAMRLNRTAVISITVSGNGTTDIPMGTFLSIFIGALVVVKLTAAIGYFLFLRRNLGQSDPRDQRFKVSSLGPDAPRGSAIQFFFSTDTALAGSRRSEHPTTAADASLTLRERKKS